MGNGYGAWGLRTGVVTSPPTRSQSRSEADHTCGSDTMPLLGPVSAGLTEYIPLALDISTASDGRRAHDRFSARLLSSAAYRQDTDGTAAVLLGGSKATNRRL
jgi:hypothetical protein